MTETTTTTFKSTSFAKRGQTKSSEVVKRVNDDISGNVAKEKKVWAKENTRFG